MLSSLHQPIRILLVEEHASIRTALCSLVDVEPDLRVIAEANDEIEALVEATRELPDVILLHLRHGGEHTIETVRRLGDVSASSRIVLLTCEQDPEFILNVVRAGARGVVSREQPAELLVRAIRKVYSGEVWLERTLMANLLGDFIRPKKANHVDPARSIMDSLSPREREVITLVCEGLRSREIGERLFIGETTVRHRLTQIYKKLGLNSRHELIKFAYDYGLVGSRNTAMLPKNGSHLSPPM
ncbi:MAG: response regulator transcription factor [Chloroflexota bacterium]